jgi:hypothetical protein
LQRPGVHLVRDEMQPDVQHRGAAIALLQVHAERLHQSSEHE